MLGTIIVNLLDIVKKRKRKKKSKSKLGQAAQKDQYAIQSESIMSLRKRSSRYISLPPFPPLLPAGRKRSLRITQIAIKITNCIMRFFPPRTPPTVAATFGAKIVLLSAHLNFKFFRHWQTRIGEMAGKFESSPRTNVTQQGIFLSLFLYAW